MATQEQIFKSLDELAMAAIEQQVGLAASLPRALLDRVFTIYKEFFSGYLNFLRQRERKPSDWMPNELVVEAELVDDMRHFFSDYQHIVKRYDHMNRSLMELKKIDRLHQPQVYDLAVYAILENQSDG